MIWSKLGFIEKLRDNFLTHKNFVDCFQMIDKTYNSLPTDKIEFVEKMPYKYFMENFLMTYTCEFNAFNTSKIKQLIQSLSSSCESQLATKFEKEATKLVEKLQSEYRNALKNTLNLHKEMNQDLYGMTKDYLATLVPVELLEGDFEKEHARLGGADYMDTYKKLRVFDGVDKAVQTNHKKCGKIRKYKKSNLEENKPVWKMNNA